MSIAGVRSNRGDGYQTLVAFDWAITVLSDPDYQWLEIDSINYDVDDIVIGKSSGNLIACQCKKNQTNFKAWTLADLSDEIDKAATTLTKNKNIKIRFYSRNNFGALAKLKEHSTTQHDEHSYTKSLGKEHSSVNSDLSARLKKTRPKLSNYEFLCRTSFVTSDDLDRMIENLLERLRNMVSNPEAAFNALWTSLDLLGARMGDDSVSTAPQHRLTKNDLKTVIQQAGATLVPPMNLAEIRHSFSYTSAIGRSWRRDIAGLRIPNKVVEELLTAIFEQKKSILLTGLPGSGKTCSMLALQETLEERAKSHSDIVPLFIQSREFADLANSDERQAQGLPEQWVEKAARLADDAKVVIVIDSLDVLSIARDHRALQYFLAQVDRLLFIPNITVVTACREFDRHYDQRIAQRKWDCEVKCKSLDWQTEVEPLLVKLGIEPTSIDIGTRQLIENPRELALFVELAQRDGSFNVVTSQALAQRYLDIIVLNDNELGDTAIQAIEALAGEMLTHRSLSLPYQRFTASDDIKRRLCSLNVLQETQDRRLTFGHQTLLDVLVISRAVRDGSTLNDFIKGLPPVPFVRPSIRSFVAYLALGERSKFRKQLRTVLTGSAAFHIRRLVAESYAEQVPQDGDWSLIRDLRDNHREVFQVIYGLAGTVDWHRFWLKYLVPYMKTSIDIEGLTGHAQRITQWSNVDTEGVLSYWADVLALDLPDYNEIADRLAINLSEIKSEYLHLAIPLLERLLKRPQSEHSFLGRVIGKCVAAGAVGDVWLWDYIAKSVRDEDILQYKLGNKLRCQAHEFGENKDFFHNRMLQSTALLDLAIQSIEHWSNFKASLYEDTRIGYRSGFLNHTSYEDTHSQRDINYSDSLDILFGTVEAAILYHASKNSTWWKKNRKRIHLNREGALLYFSILAYTSSPKSNIDLIGDMLCDAKILEFKLSYELGVLIRSAFHLLAAPIQDTVTSNILKMWTEEINGQIAPWIIRAQAELLVTIPCYLRSQAAQALVDAYEKAEGVLIAEPYIYSRGGMVGAPFSFEVFLNTSDSGVLSLLTHYDGHSNLRGIEFFIGGEREVGGLLKEAASRHPSRFLKILSERWQNISMKFRDDIMNGVATYIAHRHGNLHTHSVWTPVEEPDAAELAENILSELEKHSAQWHHRRTTAQALQACAHVIEDSLAATRLVFLSFSFLTLYEADPFHGDSVDLIDLGINMTKGDVADALMILANNFLECERDLPDLLPAALQRFARDENPAIRAIILRRLPYLQSKRPELGWNLFHLTMNNSCGLWRIAEPCLYYSYHNHFEIVKPLLARLLDEGNGKDLETWGRISALATMTKHISSEDLFANLYRSDSIAAWEGAIAVWANSENIKQHRELCINGMDTGLSSASPHSNVVAKKMMSIFRENSPVIELPITIIRKFFSAINNDSNKRNHDLFGFHEWLNSHSQNDPEQAMAALEIYLEYAIRNKLHIYDYQNSLTQLITRLFAEAEEKEESDSGALLQRVVIMQDTLLSLGVNGIVDWLKAAERP
ncbi:AAA family ATPase [Pseudomonas sp. SMN5]|uniref:AAA family ATPase n=1 Tax=Pseudomonas sp. SMN5 TaxID=3390198 RepID=UPI003F86F662